MAKKEKDILKRLGVTWITKDGFLDMAKFPIDSTLKQAMGKNEEEFRSSCRTLISMYVAGRLETALFLYGLLIHNNKNIERKEIIVEALEKHGCQAYTVDIYALLTKFPNHAFHPING